MLQCAACKRLEADDSKELMQCNAVLSQRSLITDSKRHCLGMLVNPSIGYHWSVDKKNWERNPEDAVGCGNYSDEAT